MIKITYKKFLIFRVNSYWFIDKPISNDSGISFYHGFPNNFFSKNDTIIKEQNSLITILSGVSEELLFQKLSKNYRYEIKKVMNERFTYETIDSINLINRMDLIKTFAKEFKKFAKTQKLRTKFNYSAIVQYILNKNCVLTISYIDDHISSQHLYLVDQNKTRLLYSISNFRSSNDQALYGRANKAHHWNDILYFKTHNFESLDWGGISSLDKPNGVDKFKMGFGGSSCCYFNVILANNFISTIAIKIYRWLL